MMTNVSTTNEAGRQRIFATRRVVSKGAPLGAGKAGQTSVIVPPSLSSWQKILVAADRLESDIGAFTTEALIVAAWRAFPETFGLAGYRERYPDSNRVLSKLMGAIGVRARGWIEETGVGQFRLSATGRSLAVTAGALPRPTG